jgi:3-hydroxyisobutyrate dehydrogenase-like beta-hydroxyacid dehydrogenase
MRTIGVIGLGIIGSVWARHYEAAGVLAGVWNRTPQPDFPRWKSSPEDVAAAADVVQIVVAGPPAVRGLLKRILPALDPTRVVVQSSTIDPDSSEEFRREVSARGARYLEAPFTGSRPAAEQRQTVYYLGGDPALAAEVDPLLGLVSAVRLRIGTPAQAAALKLAMNLNISTQMEGLVEALTLARRVGVEDGVFFEALSKNASYSGVAKLKEPKLRTGDFAPQFSVKHMLKDMNLASGMKASAGLPALDLVRARLDAAAQAGHADDDFSVLIRLLQG